MKSSLVQRLMFIPPLLLGAGVVWLAIANKNTPERVEYAEPVRKVRVVEALETDLTPSVVAYGTVRSANVWNAVAEVSGRIISVHGELKDGAVINPGTELLRIDPRSYQLTRAQLDAEKIELETQASNTRSALAIEQRNLALAEQELARQKALGQRGTAARTTVDQAERSMLTTRQAVRTLQSSLAVIPAQQKLLAARIEQTDLDLERTVIIAPFSLRISGMQIENNQYVGTGATLFKGESIEAAEVSVEIAPEQLRKLTLGLQDNGKLSLRQMAKSMREVLGLQAVVRFPGLVEAGSWQARFERTNMVDAQTRTISIVVSVQNPYAEAVPGVRPPLVAGMFVQVHLSGKTLSKRIVIPRLSVRDGNVQVADKEQRLRRKPVTVEFFQDDLAVIKEGVTAGESVLLTNLTPAIPGTKLHTEADADTAQLLRQAVAKP
jgi:hypothetical protein